MNKPLTFEEYWKAVGIDNDYKQLAKDAWNAATAQAVKVVNNIEKKYDGSCFLDIDILCEIAAEIEGLAVE